MSAELPLGDQLLNDFGRQSRSVMAYCAGVTHHRAPEEDMDIGSLLAALALGFVAGVIGRAVVPGDAFRSFSGWQSWMISTLLGLIGALVGYWIFTGLFGIGDEDKFDWGGIIGAIIGAIIVVALGSWLFRKIAERDVV
jgi:uncharacterized membrane protein YeaQ/YmgE (transglycosylase-associated protein family)